MRQSQIVKLNEVIMNINRLILSGSTNLFSRVSYSVTSLQLEISPPYGYSFDNANDDDAEVIAETSECSLTIEAARLVSNFINE